jgi:hypothetical protein
MVRMARILLIWLLALALPAQGVIAATMVFCGPNHHHRASVAAAAHDAYAAHSHHHDADRHGDAMTADDTVAPDKFAQSVLQKCSVCASCCSTAAICDTVPKPPILKPVAAHFAALATHVEPFAADGPDRPPRRLLA